MSQIFGSFSHGDESALSLNFKSQLKAFTAKTMSGVGVENLDFGCQMPKITIMAACSNNMAILKKILNNFRALNFITLVRENNLETFGTSHVTRTDHQNRYFCVFTVVQIAGR